MKRILLYILLSPLILLGARKDEAPKIEGIYYFLPKNSFTVLVKAKRESYFPGPLSPYAEFYLSMKGITQFSTTKWSLTSLTVSQTYTQDKNYTYQSPGELNQYLSLDKKGNLIGFNIIPKPILEVEFQPVSLTIPQPIEPPNFQPTPASNFLLLTEKFIDTNFVEPRYKRIVVEKKEEEKISAFVDYIIEIQQAKIDLERNEDIIDSNSFTVYLNELDKIEAEYLTLFTGKKVTDSFSFQFQFTPTAKDDTLILFRFSETEGILPANDMSGKPIYLYINSHHSLATIKQKMEERKEEKKQEALLEKNYVAPKEGLYYKIPDLATIQLYYDNRIVYQKDWEVAQFGIPNMLSYDMLEGGKSKITLNPYTGGILHMENDTTYVPLEK